MLIKFIENHYIIIIKCFDYLYSLSFMIFWIYFLIVGQTSKYSQNADLISLNNNYFIHFLMLILKFSMIIAHKLGMNYMNKFELKYKFDDSKYYFIIDYF